MFFLLNLLYSIFDQQPDKRKGCFEIFKDAADEYRFRLKASNGEIILVSEGYKNKQSAKKGIRSVKINADVDQNYERKRAINGQFMFNLRAINHQVIGTSEMYVSPMGRDKGIDSVKTHAPCASVVDLA